MLTSKWSDGKSAIELGEREQRAVDGGGAEDLLAIDRVLAGEPDGEALVEPRGHVLAEHGVLERDVRELVTKDLVEVGRVTAARREHADEHEMKASGTRRRSRTKAAAQPMGASLRHVFDGRRDADLDVSEDVLAEETRRARP